MSTPVQTRCLHHVHENGIHEFVMLEFSRAGVDAFAEKLQAMNATLPPGTSAPVLVDSSQGTQPVNYMFTRMRELNRTAPKTAKRSRVALLHKPGVIARMVDGMVSDPRLKPEACNSAAAHCESAT